MPKWSIHRLWARRLGVSDRVSEAVDKIIDVEKEFKGFRVGHDWIEGSIGRFKIAAELIYGEFGVEGLKAMVLHGALDYIAKLLSRGFSEEEVLWRAIAWAKFAGAKHVIRKISKLPPEERLRWVMEQSYGYYSHFGELKDVCVRVAEEVVSFIVENFNEILNSIRTDP